MKTLGPLFSVPLLVAVLTSQAAAQGTSISGEGSSVVRRKVSSGIDLTVPQEKGADGSLSEKRLLRVRGQQRLLEVMTDQVMVRSRDGKQRLHRFSGSKGLIGAASEATKMQKMAKGNRADIVAYPVDVPRTEDNKVLLTPKVSVRLMEGSDPKAFYQSSGAIQGKVPAFAQQTIILTYSTVVEAMAAVENLNAAPGVISATQIIALKRTPEYLPAEKYFLPGSGGGYVLGPTPDNILAPGPDGLGPVFGNSAYAWWANNRASGIPPLGPWWHYYLTPGPVSSVPTKVVLGDYPAIPYNPAFPLIQGELCDIRLGLAWENMVNGRRVSGYDRKILVIDNGVRKSHVDLNGGTVPPAVPQGDNIHKNFYKINAPQEFLPDPLNALDSHGTGIAGLIAARQHSNETILNGEGIIGVAPSSTIHSVLAAKGFVDDDNWAEAFVYGTTLEDKDGDGFLHDETNKGMVKFDIAVNASGASGSQVATTLFPEDYLWHMAIKFGATTQRSFRGVVYITSAGNGAGSGGPGHMDVNYSEQKNYIYQIAVGGISDLGRPIGRSNPGAALVCVAPTWGDELPPLFSWAGRPADFPTNRPSMKNPPVGPDDIPFRWRRTSQGIMTLSYAGYTPDFTGTSASAAQVAGIVALMLDVNPQLGYRDVKEILLRSCRVASDVRVAATTPGSLLNLRLHPTQWRMGALGRPMHHKMGAGLIDANKAVKLAQNWNPLSVAPMEIPAVDFDPNLPNWEDPTRLPHRNITKRDRFTGGLYTGLPNGQLIREGTTDDKWLKIGFFPTITGRMEQMEFRLRLLHGRRGDLEVKLVAPQSLNWDTGSQERMESILMEPHRDDYTNCDANNPMDWTFTTVRHWGVIGGGDAAPWELWIRDSVREGQTLTPTPEDPVYVPRANSVGGKMIGFGFRVHQSSGGAGVMDPPVVVTKILSIPPQSTPVVRALKTGALVAGPLGRSFAVTNWDFYHSSEICPVQPSNPTMEPFEFFPPGRRLPEDTSVTPVLVPLETATLTILNPLAEWPQRPLPPSWVSFYNPPPPFLPPPPPTPATEGAYGALGCRPPWVTDDMLTLNRNHLILRNPENPDPLTNFIHVRLNRKNGTLEVIPQNLGTYKIKVYAESLLGLSKPQEITIKVERPGYGLWRDTFFAPPDNSDLAISGYFADPDGDGVVNALEYTLGLNPTVADPAPIPPYTVEGNEIVFRWRHDFSKTDVTQFAQISSDLESWTDVTAVQTALNGDIEDLEFRLPFTQDVRHFFRLKAVPPP